MKYYFLLVFFMVTNVYAEEANFRGFLNHLYGEAVDNTSIAIENSANLYQDTKEKTTDVISLTVNSKFKLYNAAKEKITQSIEKGALIVEDTKNLMADYKLKAKKKFDEQRAILKEAGFELTTITVRNFGIKNMALCSSMGIACSHEVTFLKVRKLTKQDEFNLIQKYSDDKMAIFILSTLFQAPEFFNLPNHEVKEITINFSTSPPSTTAVMIPPPS